MKTFGKKQREFIYKPRKGAYAIIFEHGKVALVQTPVGYFLPGGGVENEDIETALKREVLEELGWQIKIIKFIGKAKKYFLSPTTNEYIENTGHFFTAHRIEVVGKSEFDHELVWLTPKEAEQKLFHENQKWALALTQR